MLRLRLARASLRLLLAAGLAATGQADEDAPPPEGPEHAPRTTRIERITVTGEALRELQTLPQAITGMSGEELDRAGIFDVDGLAFAVPGLHVGQAGPAEILTLRGIGTQDTSITAQPGVAFHVDGISLSRPSAASLAFFDLESLEVRRGPQGLQGGQSSTAGALYLTTRKPQHAYEVRGDVLLGNYDRMRIRGTANLPLGEHAATRINVIQEDRDGYLDNVYVGDGRDPFDADDFGLRAQLRLTPSDSVDLLLRYNYLERGGTGSQADLVPVPNAKPDCSGGWGGVRFTVMPLAAACYVEEALPQRLVFDANGHPRLLPAEYRLAPATEDADPRKIYLNDPSSRRDRYWGWSAALNWDAPALPLLGETELALLGGFQKTLNVFDQDFDASDVRLFGFDLDSDAEQYSAELRWSGFVGDRLDWQLSLHHLHEKGSRELSIPDLSTRSAVNQFSTQTSDIQSYAAALHAGLQMTRSLRLSLGGRALRDQRRTHLLRTTFVDGLLASFGGCEGSLGLTFDGAKPVPFYPNPSCQFRQRAEMWGAGLDWQPGAGHHLLYARVDRSTKPGGYQTGSVGGYAPERIWAYALGSKSELGDGRLRLNLEAFFYAYENMQLVFFDGLGLRTENADTRMHGLDVEAVALPVAGLRLSAVFSYLHTETRDYYSLDPSRVNDELQAKRLTQRDLAEANAAQQRGGLPFEQLSCSLVYAQELPCGQLGDRGGLDEFSGKRLPRSPRFSFSLGAEYEISLGGWGSLTPRIQYRWEDETTFRVFDRSFDRQDAFHRTDLKLIWTSPVQTWQLEAFVENLEDEAVKGNILIGPREWGAPPLAWYKPPRFYGLRAGYRF